MSATRSLMPDLLAEAVRLVWHKHKAQLKKFTKPRNAIEHIDDDCSNSTTYNVMNLDNNTLLVTDEPDKRIEIDVADLRRVLQARQEIVAAMQDKNEESTF